MVASDACTPEGRIPVGPGDIPQPFGGLPLARAPSRVHDARVTTRGSSSGAAGSLLAIVVVQSVTTLVLGAGGDAGLSGLLDGFVLSNATIGLALAVAGWPVARHRPRNVVGWLLLVGGLAYATSAAGYTLLARMPGSGDGRALWRVVATITNGSWPWAVAVCIPVALLVFPGGRLLSHRWRWLVGLACVNGVLMAAWAVLPTMTLTSSGLGIAGYGPWPPMDGVTWVEPAVTTLGLITYGGAIAALIQRYRIGDDLLRRQVLWVVLAGLVVVATFSVSALLEIEAWWSIFVIVLVPLSITVAILRHQLFDIRLVLSRTVLYLTMTAAIVGGYLGLLGATDLLLRRQVGLGSSVLVAGLVAVAFHPVRVWLQRRIDHLFYGDRRDPVRAVEQIGVRLSDGAAGTSTGLVGALETLCLVMRLPAASITVSRRELASFGVLPKLRQAVELRHAGEVVGELSIGLRRGEGQLDAADERVLALVSTSIAVAVHAITLADQLQVARISVVAAREEERRRLRRDLHDGLGPALTGVVLKADAARRLTASDAEQAGRLLDELRRQTTAAIDDIRRLVHDLRPPALDGFGLVTALREQASLLTHHVDGTPLCISIEVAEPLDPLPAGVEVAVYRIALEAMTNASRHSNASVVAVTLTAKDGSLSLSVTDDGDAGLPWQPGLGLISMRERATELGGTLEAGPDAAGGHVKATLPLGGIR